MSMMLGAETGQLDTLAQALLSTGDGIAETQTATQGTADQLVAEMHELFVRTIGEVNSWMDNLRDGVAAAGQQVEGTNWTGGNAESFHAGYGDFNAAMAAFELAVKEAYEGFNSQMTAISGTITEFQTQVGASLSEAKVSTDSMHVAVIGQKENLEAAMNGSMVFGGGAAAAGLQ